MRLRNVKGSRETIAASSFSIDNPQDYGSLTVEY